MKWLWHRSSSNAQFSCWNLIGVRLLKSCPLTVRGFCSRRSSHEIVFHWQEFHGIHTPYEEILGPAENDRHECSRGKASRRFVLCYNPSIELSWPISPGKCKHPHRKLRVPSHHWPVYPLSLTFHSQEIPRVPSIATMIFIFNLALLTFIRATNYPHQLYRKSRCSRNYLTISILVNNWSFRWTTSGRPLETCNWTSLASWLPWAKDQW